MSILARTGNVVHATYCQSAALQHCTRLHDVLAKNPQKLHAQIVKEAGIGLGLDFVPAAELLIAFVRTLSGGKDAYVLKALEEYERTLVVKR